MPQSKSWSDKLHIQREPKVVVIEKPFSGMPAGSRVLVGTPILVQQHIDRIPEGVTCTSKELRQRLASLYQADDTCPLTMGIFLRIIAEYSWEQIQSGKDPGEVTPFWRIISPQDPLAKKLACGPQFLRRMRAREGLL